jgi:threonine/homoserine/homoserine lactone efflux protein
MLLQGAALGLTASVSPGPLQTYLINQTLTGGWRRGAPVALAPLISDPPIVLTILLLLNQLPRRFIEVISLSGGLFVFYLAWGFWKEWRNVNIGPASGAEAHTEIQTDAQPVASPGIWSVMGRGALMNLLSPGPYTFWTLVLGPLLIDALGQSSIHGIAFLIGFYSLFVGGMLGIVALFHQARRLGPKVVRALTLLSIIILLIFGGLLILKGLRECCF